MAPFALLYTGMFLLCLQSKLHQLCMSQIKDGKVVKKMLRETMHQVYEIRMAAEEEVSSHSLSQKQDGKHCLEDQ